MEYVGMTIPQEIHPDFKKRTIPIQDNGESLMNVFTYRSPYVIEHPMYVKQQIKGALASCYVRESVMNKLEEAAMQLPSGYKIVIWDAFRPYKVQKAIFDNYYQKVKEYYPKATKDTWHEETEQFVSAPSINPLFPAPHITGGAVDITIQNARGQLLDFGTVFDDFSEKASTTYFEKKAMTQTLSKKEQQILENRRLLFHLMADAGFSNYHMEWWHYDYGNPWWAQNKEQPTAFYGIATLEGGK